MSYDNWKTNAPDPGTVSEHPAEQLFREAAEQGELAVKCYLWGTAVHREAAAELAVLAASLYHEALRASGECPVCGERLPEYDVVVGGERYAPCQSCHEPIADTYDEALAKVYDKRTA